MPLNSPRVTEPAHPGPEPTERSGSDQSLVWPVPVQGSQTSRDAPPVVWIWLTPAQLRETWTRLMPDARPPARQAPLTEVDAVSGLFGFHVPGVLQSLPSSAPLRAAQWHHALQEGQRNGECGSAILRCQITCHSRDGTWRVYPADRAIEPLRTLRVEDLVARRMSAVQSAPEAGRVLVDLARLLGTGAGYLVVAKMMDPATAPWWYALTGEEWQVLLDLPSYPRLHGGVADRLRHAPDAWRRALTHETWAAFLQHPAAVVREAAMTSFSLTSAPDGPVPAAATPRAVRPPASR